MLKPVKKISPGLRTAKLTKTAQKVLDGATIGDPASWLSLWMILVRTPTVLEAYGRNEVVETLIQFSAKNIDRVSLKKTGALTDGSVFNVENIDFDKSLQIGDLDDLNNLLKVHIPKKILEYRYFLGEVKDIAYIGNLANIWKLLYEKKPDIFSGVLETHNFMEIADLRKTPEKDLEVFFHYLNHGKTAKLILEEYVNMKNVYDKSDLTRNIKHLEFKTALEDFFESSDQHAYSVFDYGIDPMFFAMRFHQVNKILFFTNKRYLPPPMFDQQNLSFYYLLESVNPRSDATIIVTSFLTYIADEVLLSEKTELKKTSIVLPAGLPNSDSSHFSKFISAETLSKYFDITIMKNPEKENVVTFKMKSIMYEPEQLSKRIRTENIITMNFRIVENVNDSKFQTSKAFQRYYNCIRGLANNNAVEGTTFNAYETAKQVQHFIPYSKILSDGRALIEDFEFSKSINPINFSEFSSFVLQILICVDVMYTTMGFIPDFTKPFYKVATVTLWDNLDQREEQKLYNDAGAVNFLIKRFMEYELRKNKVTDDILHIKAPVFDRIIVVEPCDAMFTETSSTDSQTGYQNLVAFLYNYKKWINPEHDIRNAFEKIVDRIVKDTVTYETNPEENPVVDAIVRYSKALSLENEDPEKSVYPVSAVRLPLLCVDDLKEASLTKNRVFQINQGNHVLTSWFPDASVFCRRQMPLDVAVQQLIYKHEDEKYVETTLINIMMYHGYFVRYRYFNNFSLVVSTLKQMGVSDVYIENARKKKPEYGVELFEIYYENSHKIHSLFLFSDDHLLHARVPKTESKDVDVVSLFLFYILFKKKSLVLPPDQNEFVDSNNEGVYTTFMRRINDHPKEDGHYHISYDNNMFLISFVMRILFYLQPKEEYQELRIFDKEEAIRFCKSKYEIYKKSPDIVVDAHSLFTYYFSMKSFGDDFMIVPDHVLKLFRTNPSKFTLILQNKENTETWDEFSSVFFGTKRNSIEANVNISNLVESQLQAIESAFKEIREIKDKFKWLRKQDIENEYFRHILSCMTGMLNYFDSVIAEKKEKQIYKIMADYYIRKSEWNVTGVRLTGSSEDSELSEEVMLLKQLETSCENVSDEFVFIKRNSVENISDQVEGLIIENALLATGLKIPALAISTNSYEDVYDKTNIEHRKSVSFQLIYFLFQIAANTGSYKFTLNPKHIRVVTDNTYQTWLVGTLDGPIFMKTHNLKVEVDLANAYTRTEATFLAPTFKNLLLRNSEVLSEFLLPLQGETFFEILDSLKSSKPEGNTLILNKIVVYPNIYFLGFDAEFFEGPNALSVLDNMAGFHAKACQMSIKTNISKGDKSIPQISSMLEEQNILVESKAYVQLVNTSKKNLMLHVLYSDKPQTDRFVVEAMRDTKPFPVALMVVQKRDDGKLVLVHFNYINCFFAVLSFVSKVLFFAERDLDLELVTKDDGSWGSTKFLEFLNKFSFDETLVSEISPDFKGNEKWDSAAQFNSSTRKERVYDIFVRFVTGLTYI